MLRGVPFKRSLKPTTHLVIHKTSVFVAALSLLATTATSMQMSTTTTETCDEKAFDKAYAFDKEYPGTALERLRNVHKRVKSLKEDDLSGDWASVVRPKLLWAGGLKDLRNARPGYGYTGHALNDWNHCDITTMAESVQENENEDRVEGIHYSNQLGPGIKIASISDLGPGGSWSTCMMGCDSEPPRDVAHLQFRSKIAFKLVWVPPSFDTFVLVDDAGELLARGRPTGRLPHIRQRERNFATTGTGRYSKVARKISQEA